MSSAFLTQVLALTASLSGIVVDPQDLPVPGARVELVCDSTRTAAEADQFGRFAVGMPPASRNCRLLITHPGFAPFERPADAAANDMGRITLSIADVAQQMNVVAERGRSQMIGSVILAEQDLRTFAGSTADLIRYARMRAGGTMQPGVIYVDGLPASELPPLSRVASISVNADVFSPERSDGDVATIDIVTKAPSRTFRFNLGGDVLGIGGGDVVARDARAAAAFQNIGVAGPLPGLPITFTANAGFGDTRTDVPIRAAGPGDGTDGETATTRNQTWFASVSGHYARASSLRARVFYRESHADAENRGGGIVLPEADSSSAFVAREARASLNAPAGQVLYEGNVLVYRSQWSSRANSTAAGVTVRGDVVMGGAPVAAAATSYTEWTSNHVLRGTGQAQWALGVALSGTADADSQTRNPAGQFEFADLAAYERALAGGSTATWFVTRGNGDVRVSRVRVAPFVQKTLMVREHAEIAAGVRADYQSGLGTMVSPRVSAAARWRGVTVRAGAGLFVKDVPHTIFVAAMKNDGVRLRQFMTLDAPLTGADGPGVELPSMLRSAIAPGLKSPREWMARVAAERPIGGFVPGIEYTWTRTRSLLGSERRADGTGWVDLIQSDRGSGRHRLHAQAQYLWKGQTVSAQYEWTRGRDNTDGPFSFAAQPVGAEAEWARSAGVSSHDVTAMAGFTLPARVSLNVTYTWRSSAPYDIRTGLDTTRNGLFLDRGGRARNSGNGPGYSSLDLYAYRRVQVPNVLHSANWKLHLNIGVQAQNLLDHRNVMSVGSVAGAANFGKPISAYPGRSLRLSVSFD